MIVELEENMINRLLSQPENGMGYQIGKIQFKNQYLKKEAVIFNAEYLIPFEDINNLSKIYSFSDIIKYSSLISVSEIVDIEVYPSRNLKNLAVFRESVKSLPAIESLIEYTKLDEKFKRFSAYENDRRIDSDGSLIPGTYATTEEDARNVKTGMDAVRRYAIPNLQPAIYVFAIRPDKYTKIQKGIVQSTNNLPGGGVEVLFVDGTQPKTVIGMNKIPEGV